jgi:hypothetical protein
MERISAEMREIMTVKTQFKVFLVGHFCALNGGGRK